MENDNKYTGTETVEGIPPTVTPSNEVPRKSKNRVTLFVLAVVFLLVILSLMFIRSKDKTVFRINDKSYSQDEVTKIIAYPVGKGVDKNTVSKQAFEYLKREEAAKKAGIEIPESEVIAAKKVIFGSNIESQQGGNDAWLRKPAFDLALQNKLDQSSKGGSFKGYSFIFRFGQRLESGPGYTPPGHKDPKLVAQDRAYAEAESKRYLELLKSGNIKPEDALKAIKNDPKLGYQNTPGTNKSVRFGYTQKSWEGEVFHQPVSEYIKKSASSGLSAVQTGKTSIVDVPRNDADYAETFFYIVLLEDGNKVNLAENFSKALSGISAEYKGYK